MRAPWHRGTQQTAFDAVPSTRAAWAVLVTLKGSARGPLSDWRTARKYLDASCFALHTPMTAFLRAQPRHIEFRERPAEITGAEGGAFESESERDVARRRDPLFKQFRLARRRAIGIRQHSHYCVVGLLFLVYLLLRVTRWVDMWSTFSVEPVSHPRR